jgi:hypothetical protein
MNWARNIEQIATEHTASVHAIRNQIENVDDTARANNRLLASGPESNKKPASGQRGSLPRSEYRSDSVAALPNSSTYQR